ncbi:MAG TPA: glycosyltransferase family 2 protein [Chloroflexia bacterium]|nr:glycosyltransferase family 2 protein [Chloroflexia bacterium]
MNNTPITVLIPTFNNQAELPALLADVAWADQVLIVDSFSTDGTVEVCRQHGTDVLQHEYINSAKQKNWAIPQCAHEWILLVDTDERLPAALQTEIRTIMAADVPTEVDAYRVARRTMFLGAWLKSMNLWPDYQTRLFRRDRGCYADKEVHADVLVPGQVRTLRHALIHNATPSLSKQVGLLDRYSRYQADELEKRGVPFRWRDLTLRPVALFLYLYLLKGAWREGFRGLFLAVHTTAFSFFTYAKLWEKEWRAGLRH